MDADTISTIVDLLDKWEDSQLVQLTNYYRKGLEQAIEKTVEKVGLILTYERHFSGEEYEQIVQRTERGSHAAGSKLLLRLVMGKEPPVQKQIWKCFVKMQHVFPNLGKLLKEAEEKGSDLIESFKAMQVVLELPAHLKDVQQKHKKTLWEQTKMLRENTILTKEKVKILPLVDRYAELTIISSVRNRALVEHELLARGHDHEEWREEHLRGVLEKIRTDELFQNNYSRSNTGSGSSTAVAGVPGIGKTTLVQKIVYDWAMGKIYQHFQFVFSFKFRDLNTITCKISLNQLILDQYPYFGNILREIWKNQVGLLFIFDGLDEFKDRIDFGDSQRDIDPQRMCTDPQFRCKMSDIVYSLIQHKLLPGCSVLVTTRPAALHLLEKAEIGVWAEILGFVGEERKEYFNTFFEDLTVAAAVFKHVEENEILYTMTYNPSYCWILGQALGPFFMKKLGHSYRLPKTITQLYSYYICNILKNHSREVESPCEVLLRVGLMAFRGVAEKSIVFTDEDLIKYNLQPSHFLSGFLMELLEKEDCARSVVYTFTHLTIQEFVAALRSFLMPNAGGIQKLLTEAHSTTDGRFEVFLRFVAGLSSPLSARLLEEFLGPFPHQTTCQVIDWVKEEVKRQTGNAWSEAGKRSLLNTMHYLFESQNPALAQQTLGLVETISFGGLRLTPIDCAVLSHVIGFCGTIKCLNLEHCLIQCEGLQRLASVLHKCQELGLGANDLGDSGVKLVSAALKMPNCKVEKLRLLRNHLAPPCAEDLASGLRANRSLTELNLNDNELGDSGTKLVCAALSNTGCKIQKLWLGGNGLTESCAEDLATTLSASIFLTELYVGANKLGDSGVKAMCPALSDPRCKIQKLWLWGNGLTDSCMEDLVGALSTKCSVTDLELGSNSLSERSVPALCRLIQSLPGLQWIGFRGSQFSSSGAKQLQECRPELTVAI
ncbi:NACHT, LRR and PYD domains-containing protein 3-like isoform X1 [Rhinoraja longicauda]